MFRSAGASRNRSGRNSRGAAPPGAPGPFLEWYQALLRAYGPQGWWPGRSRFEVVVGAILTQGVAWTNVEKAVLNLRAAGLLRPVAMRRAAAARLARLIRPAGYFNQKARRLLAFVNHVHEVHHGRLDDLFRRDVADLRAELLALPGIGRETADAIILYAAGKPSFVVDAYTRRILRRHGEAHGNEPYDDLRLRLERSLPAGAALYNEYHALLVRLGKERCLKSGPRCDGCPLEPHLPRGGPRPDLRSGAPSGRAPVLNRGRTPGRGKLTQDIVSTRVTPR